MPNQQHLCLSYLLDTGYYVNLVFPKKNLEVYFHCYPVSPLIRNKLWRAWYKILFLTSKEAT